MVHAAPAPDRVLLQRPQARCGLSSVADRGAAARDGIDPLTGEGGDARQMPEQIQRGAFGGEQRARRVAWLKGEAESASGAKSETPGTGKVK